MRDNVRFDMKRKEHLYFFNRPSSQKNENRKRSFQIDVGKIKNSYSRKEDRFPKKRRTSGTLKGSTKDERRLRHGPSTEEETAIAGGTD